MRAVCEMASGSFDGRDVDNLEYLDWSDLLTPLSPGHWVSMSRETDLPDTRGRHEPGEDSCVLIFQFSITTGKERFV